MAGDAHPLSPQGAVEQGAPRRGLPADEFLPAEPPAPAGDGKAVGRAADGFLGNAELGAEGTRLAVGLFPRHIPRRHVHEAGLETAHGFKIGPDAGYGGRGLEDAEQISVKPALVRHGAAQAFA